MYSEPTRQFLEERILNSSRKFSWQDQAEALFYVQDNKHQTWMVWKRLDKSAKPTKLGFESFADYVKYCGIAFSGAYKKTRIAKRRDYFNEIRDAEITVELVIELYKLDLLTFKRLVASKRMQATEKEIFELIIGANIPEAAIALLTKKLALHEALGAYAKKLLNL